MSYARFSSDNWKSDVYVYECEIGYCIHVAARRHVGVKEVGPLPQEDDFDSKEDYELALSDYIVERVEQTESLDEAELVPIGGPYDGEVFVLSLKEAIEKLKQIRKAGYHVPQYAIDALVEELDEV